MTRRAHFGVWLMLSLCSFVVWPLWTLVQPQGSLQPTDEAVHALRLLGPRLSPWLASALATDTGLEEDVPTAVATPTRHRAPHREPGAAANVGRDAAPTGVGRMSRQPRRLASLPAVVDDKVARYLHALQVQWQRCVWRGAVMLSWSLLLVPLWGAAVVDGLSRRAVKMASMGYQNPAAFTLASHALVLTAMLPVFVLVLPFQVTPWFMPAWSVLAMWPLRTAIAHMQPVFTR